MGPKLAFPRECEGGSAIPIRGGTHYGSYALAPPAHGLGNPADAPVEFVAYGATSPGQFAVVQKWKWSIVGACASPFSC